jgi:hypothetical protein
MGSSVLARARQMGYQQSGNIVEKSEISHHWFAE